MHKWELCFVRPKVRTGAEVVFFHPDLLKNKQHCNFADFIKSRGQKPDVEALQLGTVLSFILADGWEPLNIGGGVGEWVGTNPDFGATGFAFRRQVEPS
jgi:hypothetical protein